MVGLLCFYLVHFKFDVQYQWNIRINYIGPFLSKQRINKGRTVRTRIFWSSNKYILLSEQRYFVICTRRFCLRTKILCRIPTKILCYRKLGYLALRTKILCCQNKVTLLSEQGYSTLLFGQGYLAIPTRILSITL